MNCSAGDISTAVCHETLSRDRRQNFEAPPSKTKFPLNRVRVSEVWLLLVASTGVNVSIRTGVLRAEVSPGLRTRRAVEERSGLISTTRGSFTCAQTSAHGRFRFSPSSEKRPIRPGSNARLHQAAHIYVLQRKHVQIVQNVFNKPHVLMASIKVYAILSLSASVEYFLISDSSNLIRDAFAHNPRRLRY